MHGHRDQGHHAYHNYGNYVLPLEEEGDDDNFVSSARRTFESISDGILSLVNPFGSVANCCTVTAKEQKMASVVGTQRSAPPVASSPGIQKRPPAHGMYEQLPARMPPSMSARFSPLEDFPVEGYNQHHQHQQRGQQGRWGMTPTSSHEEETQTSLSRGIYSTESASMLGRDTEAATTPPSRIHHHQNHRNQHMNQETAADYYCLSYPAEHSQPGDQQSAGRGSGWSHDHDEQQHKQQILDQQRQVQHHHEHEHQNAPLQNGSHHAAERVVSAGGHTNNDRRMTKLEAEERMFGMSLGDSSKHQSPLRSGVSVHRSDTPSSIVSFQADRAVWEETVPPYLSLESFESPTPRPLFKNFKIRAEIFEASEGTDTPLSVV